MKRLIFIVVTLLTLVTGISAGAEYVPQIEGETEFNNNVTALMSGEELLKPKEILIGLAQDATRELKQSMSSMTLIFITALLSGAIGVLSDSFGKRAGADAAFFACFALMSASALSSFSAALKYGGEVIAAMSNFVTRLSPLLMTLLITCGKAVSASVFHPVLSAAVFVMTLLIQRVLMPLNVFGAVLSVSGNLGGGARIGGFCALIRSINKWVMSAMITLFTGISAIYGFSAPSVDALSMKAVKFAAGTLVPVVGGFVADTAETVMSASRLMKNAVGAAGIIAISAMCLVPILKIGAIYFMLRLSAALSETVTDKRISGMLNDIAGAAGNVFGLVVMTAVLFVLNLCIVLAATNFS